MRIDHEQRDDSERDDDERDDAEDSEQDERHERVRAMPHAQARRQMPILTMVARTGVQRERDAGDQGRDVKRSDAEDQDHDERCERVRAVHALRFSRAKSHHVLPRRQESRKHPSKTKSNAACSSDCHCARQTTHSPYCMRLPIAVGSR